MCGSDHAALSLRLLVGADPLCMDRVGSFIAWDQLSIQLMIFQGLPMPSYEFDLVALDALRSAERV